MGVKTLSITEAIVNEVDESKFAFYNFMDRKCCYWLKGNTKHLVGTNNEATEYYRYH